MALDELFVVEKVKFEMGFDENFALIIFGGIRRD